MANQKKKIVPNFPLMTTTDSQNFKEIQETDVHHVVTLEEDFPFFQNFLEDRALTGGLTCSFVCNMHLLFHSFIKAFLSNINAAFLQRLITNSTNSPSSPRGEQLIRNEAQTKFS